MPRQRTRPNLVFQVLTKRPERIKEHLPADWGEGYPNVWLGASVERDDYCFRADVLRSLAEKPQLFHTPYARQRWEAAARANLERELGTLGA